MQRFRSRVDDAFIDARKRRKKSPRKAHVARARARDEDGRFHADKRGRYVGLTLDVSNSYAQLSSARSEKLRLEMQEANMRAAKTLRNARADSSNRIDDAVAERARVEREQRAIVLKEQERINKQRREDEREQQRRAQEQADRAEAERLAREKHLAEARIKLAENLTATVQKLETT